jgi:glycosyltransferase involved in cell wall biosynthesis
MNKSKSIKDRNFLLLKTKKIIFNSNWTKKRFLTGLKSNKNILKKISVIHQSTDKVKVNLNKKKKIIIFIGRLNSSKGYDLFGHAIIKILKKYKDWKSLVIGDEHREKLYFNHPNLIVLGFQNHKKTLNYLKYSSISVVCSKWDEPFGRTALEASSRGCAVIISNKGGLPEAVTDSLKINKLSVNSVYNAIDKLINNSKLRTTLQKKSLKNFYLHNKFISKKIDDYRFNILKT